MVGVDSSVSVDSDTDSAEVSGRGPPEFGYFSIRYIHCISTIGTPVSGVSELDISFLLTAPWQWAAGHTRQREGVASTRVATTLFVVVRAAS